MAAFLKPPTAAPSIYSPRAICADTRKTFASTDRGRRTDFFLIVDRQS